MSPDPRADERRSIVTVLNECFAAIAGWSFDHRWWVVVLAIVLLAGSVVLAGRARVDSSFEAYFDPRDPAYLAYEQFQEHRAHTYRAEQVRMVVSAPRAVPSSGSAHSSCSPWSVTLTRSTIRSHGGPDSV